MSTSKQCQSYASLITYFIHYTQTTLWLLVFLGF